MALIKKFLYGGPGYFMDRLTVDGLQQTGRKISRGIAKGGLSILGWLGNAFNTLITSGASTDYGLTSPFVNMDRTRVANAKEATRLKAKQTVEKAMPYISPSNHIVSWFNGSLNPMVGALKIAEAGPEALFASALFDMATFAKGKAAVRNTVRTVDEGLAFTGNKSAQGRTIAREMLDINPEAVGEVADAYTMDRSITGPIVLFDGKNRYIYKNNRFRKETGNGLLNVKFKPFSPENNHRLALDPAEPLLLPSNTYYMNLSILPYKRSSGRAFGNEIDTSLYPNLQYNAYRYLHWTEPKVQELGMLYLSTGDLGPIVLYYRTASPLEKQLLSAIARLPAFLNSETPYRYYTDNNLVMLENPSILRMVNKLNKRDLLEFNNSLGWATTNDLDYPVIFNKKSGFLGNKVVSHEGNHAYQLRFAQSLNMLNLLEKALPAALTKFVRGKEVRITGNDKTGVGSAHLNVERGSTLHETRSLLIRNYYLLNGRFPTFLELNSMIDGMDNASLTKTIRSSNGYGQEYAPLITDFSALKEALKYGYKKGGKIW